MVKANVLEKDRGVAEEFAHRSGSHFEIGGGRHDRRSGDAMIGKPRKKSRVETSCPRWLRMRLAIAEQGMRRRSSQLARGLRILVPEVLALPRIRRQSDRA